MKYIPIKTCDDCPDKDHKGGFGQVAYIPTCKHIGKTLGYTTSVTNAGRVYAAYDNIIPDWCPLPESPDEVA